MLVQVCSLKKTLSVKDRIRKIIKMKMKPKMCTFWPSDKENIIRQKKNAEETHNLYYLQLDLFKLE